MSSTVDRLTSQKLIQPPKWLSKNVHYETLTGSVSYGVSSDTSDIDLVGWCIPTKEIIFPHTAGYLVGFDKDYPKFDQFQQHGIRDNGSEKNYDVSIYSIIRYFALVSECNPNMIDSLFTPVNCVLHISPIGQMVRDERKIFLHKGCYHKFLGYAYSQLHKMSSKSPEGKRVEMVEKWGFDLKYAYHLVRLAYECEQILSEGDLDLQRPKEHLKAIRRGEVKEQEIRDWFSLREKGLEKLYQDSKLQYSPDMAKIKQLLINCLEHHYGSLEDSIVNVDKATQTLREIQQLITKRGF